MAEGSGAYIAAAIVVIIIILLLVFFFFSGSGCGNIIPCLKACRICASAADNQIQLGPCCEAKITNKVGQKTTYTLPDPGTDAASFLLSVGTGQTLNGNSLVTSSGGTGLVSGGAVTVNGTSGSIDFPSTGAVLTGNDIGTFTLNNSSIKAGSIVLLTVHDPTPTLNAQVTAVAVAQADGSLTIRLANGGSASTADHAVFVNFLVL